MLVLLAAGCVASHLRAPSDGIPDFRQLAWPEMLAPPPGVDKNGKVQADLLADEDPMDDLQNIVKEADEDTKEVKKDFAVEKYLQSPQYEQDELRQEDREAEAEPDDTEGGSPDADDPGSGATPYAGRGPATPASLLERVSSASRNPDSDSQEARKEQEEYARTHPIRMTANGTMELTSDKERVDADNEYGKGFMENVLSQANRKMSHPEKEEVLLREGVMRMHPQWGVDLLGDQPTKVRQLYVLLSLASAPADPTFGAVGRTTLFNLYHGIHCMRNQCKEEVDACVQAHPVCKKRLKCLTDGASQSYHLPGCWEDMDGENPSPQERTAMDCTYRCADPDHERRVAKGAATSFVEGLLMLSRAHNSSALPGYEEPAHGYSEEEELKTLELHHPGLSAEDELAFHAAFERGQQNERKRLAKIGAPRLRRK